MSYEFRKKESKFKYKSNKWEKNNNKKMDTKNKKIKQKRMLSKYKIKEELKSKNKWENFSAKWTDIYVDKNLVRKWILAWKRWNLFVVMDIANDVFHDTVIDDKIPTHLRWTFVVGDFVFFNKEGWSFILKKRLLRKNYLSKTKSNTSRFWGWREQIIVANVDIAVIIVPVKNPKFDPKLVDRYLVLCQNWWVTPIICLNKVDLTDYRNPIIQDYIKSWIMVIETSFIDWKGISKLKKLLLNKKVVVLWKSWVGKTSLVNLLGLGVKLQTQNVNEKSWEWKHTTTSTNLYKWEEKSYIIDTPGVRALWLDQIKKSELKTYFPEFEKYKWFCKYKRCLHNTEPDCAIKKAVANGEISTFRYESYLRISEDLI